MHRVMIRKPVELFIRKEHEYQLKLYCDTMTWPAKKYKTNSSWFLKHCQEISWIDVTVLSQTS